MAATSAPKVSKERKGRLETCVASWEALAGLYRVLLPLLTTNTTLALTAPRASGAQILWRSVAPHPQGAGARSEVGC